MITGIAAIIYNVSDLNQACDFYTQVLGLTLRYKNEKDSWAEFLIGDSRFAIRKHSPFGNGDNPTLSLLVSNMEKFVGLLKSKGVKFQGEIVYEYFGKMIEFSDPDNNVITLFEPPNG